MPEDFVSIFAYGSNLHPIRMLRRAASARVTSIGCVVGRTLRFHKVGVDGSGKADAFWTGATEDRVWGAVYAVSRPDRVEIDACESVGVGYDRIVVNVQLSCGDVCQAFMYEALPRAVNHSAVPFDWYHELVVAGAEHHRLPTRYTRSIARVQSVKDPDAARDQQHRMLLQHS